MGIQYQIILRGGDGNEFGPWHVRDHYFQREWKKIGEEILETIREHDATYEDGGPYEPKFKHCRFCGATSVGDRERHKVGCTRPRGGDDD